MDPIQQPRVRSSPSSNACILEDRINALAASQFGVVTRAQLIEAGVSVKKLDRWIASRRVRLLHRGVYLVGPLMIARAREMAAVLACGPTAVVSHLSAAALCEMLQALDRAAPIDVTITRGGHRRPGIRVHRVFTLHSAEITTLEGIPMTTVARTLLDIAFTLPAPQLERAVEQALGTRLTTQAHVIDVLNRHAGTPGAARLRALIKPEPPAFTRSEAEAQLLTLIRKAKLVRPEVNVMVCGHEVDFFWRTERFIVEMDGFAYHASHRKFESDRRRDAVLAAAGMRVIRVTWQQLVKQPEALIATLALALAR